MASTVRLKSYKVFIELTWKLRMRRGSHLTIKCTKVNILRALLQSLQWSVVRW